MLRRPGTCDVCGCGCVGETLVVEAGGHLPTTLSQPGLRFKVGVVQGWGAVPALWCLHISSQLLYMNQLFVSPRTSLTLEVYS